MAMEAKRIPYLVFLFVLLFSFQMTEYMFELGAGPVDAYGQKIEVEHNVTGIDTAEIDILGGIFDFFVISVPDSPALITMLLTFINGILLTMFAYLVATIILDALPFVGG